MKFIVTSWFLFERFSWKSIPEKLACLTASLSFFLLICQPAFTWVLLPALPPAYRPHTQQPSALSPSCQPTSHPSSSGQPAYLPSSSLPVCLSIFLMPASLLPCLPATFQWFCIPFSSLIFKSSSHLCLYLPTAFFTSGPPTKCSKHLSCLPQCHVPHPSHSFLFDHPNDNSAISWSLVRRSPTGCMCF